MDRIERRFASVSDPIAAMIFFAPEATDAYGELGLNWFEGYFCSRSAAFGGACAEVVISTFFNFSPGAVRRAVEGGWIKTTPEVLSEKRFVAAGKALRRMLADDGNLSSDVARTNELLWRLVENAPPQGRPLYAAHLGQPRRQDELESLWQAANLMREFRGDCHIAVLVAHELGAVDALVLHAAMLGMPRERLMSGPRDWPADDVAAALKHLAERGLVDGETVTPEGTALRQSIEDQTDRVTSPPFVALGQEAEELVELLRPVSERAGQRRR